MSNIIPQLQKKYVQQQYRTRTVTTVFGLLIGIAVISLFFMGGTLLYVLRRQVEVRRQLRAIEKKGIVLQQKDITAIQSRITAVQETVAMPVAPFPYTTLIALSDVVQTQSTNSTFVINGSNSVIISGEIKTATSFDTIVRRSKAQKRCSLNEQHVNTVDKTFIITIQCQ